MTLEQQLFALLEQHNLSSLSITVYSGDEKYPAWIGASAQANALAAFDSVRDDRTITAVIGSAIGNLNVKRTPPVEQIDTLAPMDLAA